MVLTNSSSQMILSITHTRTHAHINSDTHTRTHTTLTCQTLVMGSLRDWSCISHSAGANVYSHTKVPPPTHAHSHTYHPEAEHGSVSLEQESCSLSQTSLLFRPSDSGYILCVCECVHMCACVCLNVCTFECLCASSLIALTPASVKWDSLPLSVFKRRAERAEWLKWTDGSCRLPVRWAC